MRKESLIKKQKVMHLATTNSRGAPHLVPVWYKKIGTKFYIGTNTKTIKAKNISKNNKVCFCIDIGVWHPIDGMMVLGKAKILKEQKTVKKIAGEILLRYFKSLQEKSAKQLLENTDCVIEITPVKTSSWHY
ncbi:MAG: pyridoxamine 5'-phosphate oxidase family protein [Candidatus Nitrosotenuis sp.]